MLDHRHVSYRGPEISDFDVFDKLPEELRELLQDVNGCILFHGGLHIRGACAEPDWHSIRTVWSGPFALQFSYSAIKASDIPFAEDCVGDQFFLRGGIVHKLEAEEGKIISLEKKLTDFIQMTQKNPTEHLMLDLLRDFEESTQSQLKPGELLDVYPLFCMMQDDQGVDLTPVPGLERIAYLAEAAKQISKLPPGAKIEIERKIYAPPPRPAGKKQETPPAIISTLKKLTAKIESHAELELIADYQCVCGEGPLWHAKEHKLYWTDIDTGRMFRFDPVKNTHEEFYKGDVVGGFTIQADGALLLFMAKGTVKLWRNGELTTVIEEIPEERETRFNDVIADPAGRVFCGTMPTKDQPGRLYRLDTDGKITKLLDRIGCSNGLGFTPDRKHLYYTDSPKREIYIFDFDRNSGTISNQRVFVHSNESSGMPDGLTVDADGFIWSAHWDGSCLIRYTPDGKEDRRILFPVKKISSVTFGGDDHLRDIYITTAGGDKKSTDGEHAGALFRLRLGIRGLPEFLSRVNL